jgi:hypothetical protein
MYTETRNDLETFLQMDSFWTADEAALAAAMSNDNWQVQQAALAAIGDRGLRDMLPTVVDALKQQNDMGVYDCPDEWELDGTTNMNERETWRCRFRVKQAAIIAIGKCIDAHGSDLIDGEWCTATTARKSIAIIEGE